jgi:hypothetical protein
MAGEHLEFHTACREIVNGVDEMAQVSAEPIKLPGDKRISLSEGLEAGR